MLFLQDGAQLCTERALGILLGGRSRVHLGGLERAKVQALMDGTGAAGACAATRKHFRDAQLQQAVIQS